MDMGLKNKSVVVTGGASNIGRGITLAFAREGARVVIADIDREQAEKTLRSANELGGGGLFIECDVTRIEQVDGMVATCLASLGAVDVLVNNVGRPVDGSLVSQTDETVRRQLDLNLIGTVNCIRAVLPHMTAQGYGRIVNVASESGRVGDPKRPIYSACKGAVIALTKAIAREAGAFQVTVNAVCPHTVLPLDAQDEAGRGSMFNPETGIYGRRLSKMLQSPDMRESHLTEHVIKRFGTPDDISAAVVFLASGSAGYITGQTLSVNGGHSMI